MPGFLDRVLRFAVPAGIVAAVASLTAYGVAFYMADLSLRQSRTSATLVLSAVGLWVLVCLARPFNWWRTLLVAAMVVSIAVILFVPALRNFYELQRPRHGRRRRDGGDRRHSRWWRSRSCGASPSGRSRRRNPEYAAAAADA